MHIKHHCVFLSVFNIILSNKNNFEPPMIVEPVKKVSLFHKENETVTISCKATGVPSPLYEWRLNDDPINNKYIKFDAVTGVLTIPLLSIKQEGVFRCRATNRFANGQSATTLSAEVEVRVARIEDFNTAQPKTLNVQMGKYVMLECDDNKPLHYGPTSFKWFFKTAKGTLTEILQDERKYIDQVGSLHFVYILKSDEAKYQCALSNSVQGTIRLGRDNIINVSASSLQETKPVLQFRSAGKSLEVLLNEDAMMECIFSAYTNASNATNKAPVITWYDDTNAEIVSGGRYSIGSYGRTLTIKNVQEVDEKTYTCRGSNAVGQDTKQLHLNVTSTPIWVEPLEKMSVVEGENAKFTCEARSAVGEISPDPPEWYRNGYHMERVYDPIKYKFSQDKRELTVLNVRQESDVSCFQCFVANSNGFEFANGCLTVTLENKIISSNLIMEVIVALLLIAICIAVVFGVVFRCKYRRAVQKSMSRNRKDIHVTTLPCEPTQVSRTEDFVYSYIRDCTLDNHYINYPFPTPGNQVSEKSIYDVPISSIMMTSPKTDDDEGLPTADTEENNGRPLPSPTKPLDRPISPVTNLPHPQVTAPQIARYSSLLTSDQNKEISGYTPLKPTDEI